MSKDPASPSFFLSYSAVDGNELANYLFTTLQKKKPPVTFWMDKYCQIDGLLWDIQIRNAIRDCLGLIFIMTPDSIEEHSGCYDEWTLGLKYKKHIIPVLADRHAEVPFRLHQRQYIDFTESWESGAARLWHHLVWLRTPEGELQRLKDQMADAKRDLRRAREPNEESRIKGEIVQIAQEIHTLTQVVESPESTERHLHARIERELEITRRATHQHQTFRRIVNIPPLVAPSYFQNRHVETALVGKFLQDKSVRVITVMGRGGVGKTTMVCRLLASVSDGELPDSREPVNIHGLVYLGERSSRRIKFSNLFSDVSSLLPEEEQSRLITLYKNPQVDVPTKITELLKHFRQRKAIVLLDNFEDCLHPETSKILDDELAATLQTVLKTPAHQLKIVITTRAVPYNISLIQPALQRRIDLDKGLPSPYAENILREMDFDGKVGLKNAPAHLLTAARELTRGYPRALEAFFAILSVDRETTLVDLLNDTKDLLPENVIDALIGEAFNRLAPRQKAIMQALAVYDHPVPAIALDYLLQPYVPAMESETYLKQLVNMLFVRRESSKYYLHPLDRQYAFEQIPEGTPEDYRNPTPVFTQYGLLARAAEYFSQISKPSSDWFRIEDVEPQLAEFELRYQVMDYERAFAVLEQLSTEDRRGGVLFSWGHYREMIALYERLQNKLLDWESQQLCFTQLGYAYGEIGPLAKAIEYLQRALEIAKQRNDLASEGNLLGWIASTYKEQGKYHKAIEYHESALKIAYELDNNEAISYNLGESGFCYRDLGNVKQALELYERAVEHDKKSGNKSDEGAALRNIGICYHWLGDTKRGLFYLQQALEISRELDSPRRLSLTLSAMAHAHLGDGDLVAAKQRASEAIHIADGIGLIRVQNEARWIIALAHLLEGDLLAAKSHLEEAQDVEYPRNSHNIYFLLGTTLILLDESMPAMKAFREALASSSSLLVHADSNFRALSVTALSYCGLMLCGLDGYTEKALEALHQSWALNQDSGITQETYQLFRLLNQTDNQGKLRAVEQVVTETLSE